MPGRFVTGLGRQRNHLGRPALKSFDIQPQRHLRICRLAQFAFDIHHRGA